MFIYNNIIISYSLFFIYIVQSTVDIRPLDVTQYNITFHINI